MHPVELIITLKPDGNVTVQGPVTNKLACYGLLEMARDAIRDFKPEQGPGLLVAQGSLPNGHKGK